MKRIVTEQDIQKGNIQGVFKVSRDMIITPWAREWASRHNIRLEYEQAPSSEDLPVEAREDLDAAAEAVAQEVLRTLTTSTAAAEENSNTPLSSPPGLDTGEDENLGVVVATGLNRPGVAAALSAAISECGGDILDISQTLAGEYYSMIFVVDTKGISTRGLTFMEFKHRVEDAGARVGAHCMVINAKVLKAMHRV